MERCVDEDEDDDEFLGDERCPVEACYIPPAHLQVVRALLNNSRKDSKHQYCDPRSKECECAESECCSNCGQSIEEDDPRGGVKADRRLKAWERELKLRQRIGKRIMKRTGKMACQLLFNRRSGDDRDKIVIQTLLEQADRLNGTPVIPLQGISRSTQSEHCDLGAGNSAVILPAQTFPGRTMEISGVPARLREEMYGPLCSCNVTKRWIDSEFLHQSISERKNGLRRIAEFFPDIEHLVVVGKAMTLHESEDQGNAVLVPQDGDTCACNCGVQIIHPAPPRRRWIIESQEEYQHKKLEDAADSDFDADANTDADAETEIHNADENADDANVDETNNDTDNGDANNADENNDANNADENNDEATESVTFPQNNDVDGTDEVSPRRSIIKRSSVRSSEPSRVLVNVEVITAATTESEEQILNEDNEVVQIVRRRSSSGVKRTSQTEDNK